MAKELSRLLTSVAAFALSASAAFASPCLYPGDDLTAAASLLGPIGTFTQTGPGKCEVTGSSLVANATTDALNCDAKVFAGRTLAPPWTLNEVVLRDDPYVYVTKQKAGTKSLGFEIMLPAAAGDSSAVTIMSLSVSGPAGECPKIGDLIL